MRATEFVKKFGWEEAINLLNATSWTMRQIALSTLVDTKELQNLVNAYELVEVGLPELKKAMFSDSKDLDYVKNWVLTVSEKLLTEKGINLKQAIELVESVNE